MASHLFTHQKDDVYRRIETAGLDPIEFKWEKEVEPRFDLNFKKTKEETVGRCLVHTPTGYNFAFIDANESVLSKGNPPKAAHSVRFFPSEDKHEVRIHEISWETVLEWVDHWLSGVKLEYETTNLWEQLRRSQLPTLKSSLDESSSLTPDEVERVGVSVDQVAESIRANQDSLGLLSEQVNYLIGEIDDLKRLAEHTTKRQLRQTLVGILFSFSLQIGFDPKRTKQLLELVGKAFDWLVELSYYLPKG